MFKLSITREILSLDSGKSLLLLALKKCSSNDEGNETISLNFIEFKLEVEYADQKKYEAEYEVDNGNIEAEIEDDLNDIKVKGNEASQKLEPLFKELNIKQDTPKEVAIKNTLNVFGVPDDYLKFELEITFDNNTEIEFEDDK